MAIFYPKITDRPGKAIDDEILSNENPIEQERQFQTYIVKIP